MINLQRDPDRAHFPTGNQLTVSDFERLAKAGVKIEFEQIANQIVQDRMPPPPQTCHRTLNESFWDRYRRAHCHHYEGSMQPYDIHASAHGDKVYVFVMPSNTDAPFVLEDDAPLYPSDALMAKLVLWEKTK